MKRGIAVALVLVAALTGCATDGGTRDGWVGGDPVYVFTRSVNGHDVWCIAHRDGLSCDWGVAPWPR